MNFKTEHCKQLVSKQTNTERINWKDQTLKKPHKKKGWKCRTINNKALDSCEEVK